MKKNELIVELQKRTKKTSCDLSWLDCNKEFIFLKTKHKITSDGKILYWNDKTQSWYSFDDDEKAEVMRCLLLISYHMIEPVSSFTTAEAEQARRDMACSGGFVEVKHFGDKVCLLNKHGVAWRIPSDTYPSLKSGEKTQLIVIARYKHLL